MICREHFEADCEVSEVLLHDEVFANLLEYFWAEWAGQADPRKIGEIFSLSDFLYGTSLVSV